MILLSSAIVLPVGGSMGGGDDEPADADAMAAAVNWPAIILFLGFFLTLGAWFYAFNFNSERLRSINFLNHPPLKSLLKSRWYPLIFVLPTLGVFGIIIVQLFFGSLEVTDNFGAVMVWILLWPILPVLFLLFGRLWCSICPMSRVSDEVQSRIGLNRKVPTFLRKYGVWIIIVAFLAITWSDVVLGLVESPRNTGFLLLFVFAGVVLMGAIFERRAWCRYLCFLGGLSSNYSMSSALELRADSEICKTCKEPVCYIGTEKAGGCPMFEYPRMMDSNSFCNFCANCIKNCPLGAIKISPRLPTSELWFIKKPRFVDSFFATVLLGIVVSQTVVMLEVWDPFVEWFEGATGITNFTVAWTVIFAGAMLIPLLLMLGFSFLSTLFTAASPAAQNRLGDRMLSNFAHYGYALIPLGLGIHLAHNAKHFLGEGLSVAYASASLAGFDFTGDLSLLNMPTIQVIQYILTFLGIVGAAYTAYRISLKTPHSRLSVLPYLAMILVFGVMALWMYGIPMATRAH